VDGPAEFSQGLDLKAMLYRDGWRAMAERPDRTSTAPSGHFHFLDLPDGEYRLAASLPDSGTRYGQRTTEAVTVSRDAAGKVRIARVHVSLPPTVLKGCITDRSTGTPIVLAEVRVRGSGEHTFSDNHGEYRLIALEQGRRKVQVSARGYQRADEPVEVEVEVELQRGDTRTLHFSLEAE